MAYVASASDGAHLFSWRTLPLGRRHMSMLHKWCSVRKSLMAIVSYGRPRQPMFTATNACQRPAQVDAASGTAWKGTRWQTLASPGAAPVSPRWRPCSSWPELPRPRVTPDSERARYAGLARCAECGPLGKKDQASRRHSRGRACRSRQSLTRSRLWPRANVVLEMAGESLKAKLTMIQELDEGLRRSRGARLRHQRAQCQQAGVGSAQTGTSGRTSASLPLFSSIRIVEVVPGLRTDAVTIERVSDLLRGLDRRTDSWRATALVSCSDVSPRSISAKQSDCSKKAAHPWKRLMRWCADWASRPGHASGSRPHRTRQRPRGEQGLVRRERRLEMLVIDRRPSWWNW